MPVPAVVDHLVDGAPFGETADVAVVDEEVGVELACTDCCIIHLFAGIVAVDGKEFESPPGAKVNGFLQKLAFAGGPEDEAVAF